jgi:TrwC relaxase
LPKEVSDLARYYTQGTQMPGPQPGEAAVDLRHDLHPLVAKGLGLDPERAPTREEIGAMLAGRRADGKKIEGKHYPEVRTVTDKRTGQTKELIPIGAYDFTLTPDKSVSVAWAFAAPAEQAAIWQAHRDAAHEAMTYLETIIGRARLGHDGREGFEPGHVGWLAFDHYTARPTLTMAVQKNGQTVTELVPVPVPGDPDLHTHVLVPNAVFCDSGRVGALDTAQLQGAVKEVGALYQAHLAQHLRDRLSASVSLDPETGMARLDAIPDPVRTHFSKRTLGGEEAARAYAKELGLDWDTLAPGC